MTGRKATGPAVRNLLRTGHPRRRVLNYSSRRHKIPDSLQLMCETIEENARARMIIEDGPPVGPNRWYPNIGLKASTNTFEDYTARFSDYRILASEPMDQIILEQEKGIGTPGKDGSLAKTTQTTTPALNVYSSKIMKASPTVKQTGKWQTGNIAKAGYIAKTKQATASNVYPFKIVKATPASKVSSSKLVKATQWANQTATSDIGSIAKSGNMAETKQATPAWNIYSSEIFKAAPIAKQTATSYTGSIVKDGTKAETKEATSPSSNLYSSEIFEVTPASNVHFSKTVKADPTAKQTSTSDTDSVAKDGHMAETKQATLASNLHSSEMVKDPMVKPTATSDTGSIPKNGSKAETKQTTTPASNFYSSEIVKAPPVWNVYSSETVKATPVSNGHSSKIFKATPTAKQTATLDAGNIETSEVKSSKNNAKDNSWKKLNMFQRNNIIPVYLRKVFKPKYPLRTSSGNLSANVPSDILKTLATQVSSENQGSVPGIAGQESTVAANTVSQLKTSSLQQETNNGNSKKSEDLQCLLSRSRPLKEQASEYRDPEVHTAYSTTKTIPEENQANCSMQKSQKHQTSLEQVNVQHSNAKATSKIVDVTPNEQQLKKPLEIGNEIISPDGSYSLNLPLKTPMPGYPKSILFSDGHHLVNRLT